MATLPPELMAQMGMGGGMPQMPPGQPPAGAMTADGPMGPDMPPPSAGMMLAEMGGMLDQKVQELDITKEQIQQFAGMVAQMFQQIVGAGVATADGPMGPEAQGLAPEDELGMEDPMGEEMPMEEDPMGGMPFNAQQLAMQRGM